ncbi:MAG: ThiF family adenylyltransferase [Hyphomicrobiales bacterium]
MTLHIREQAEPMRPCPLDRRLRYAGNILLPEIGENGQERLLSAKVLVIGGGGLGSALLFYLAAAGVGTLGLVDDDRVALSNLQRQILYGGGDVGRPKVESAEKRLHSLNPDIDYIVYQRRLDADNADELIAGYDLVADGCDNFKTRFIVNAACLWQEKTLVSAAVTGFSGQLYTFKPYRGAPHPCYRCLYPDTLTDATPGCSQSGVLGSLAGQMGSWQATEVVKELLGLGESLSGRMMVVEALTNTIRKLTIKRNPSCPCCGGADVARTADGPS